MENFNYFEPTEEQLRKFHEINSKTSKEFDKECSYYNDCSICPFAIHQQLFITTKNTCVYGLTEEKFRIKMMDADCEF